MAYHNHDVPPAALVQLLHHVLEVREAVPVEGEVSLGVHVVQVVPLHVLKQRTGAEEGREPRGRELGLPSPWLPPLTSGKCDLVMFSTTWRTMAVEE